MSPRPAPIADWVTIDELYADPFPTYERLRAEGGVHWVPAVGRYLITSYEAVHETELDQTVYSANEEGSLQIRAMGHSMLRRDDPEHMIERRAWQPALRPGAVKRTWRAVFEKYANLHLDNLIEKGPGADLIWDFAAPFAGDSLREVTGLYNATHEDMQRWSQLMIDATGNYADDPEVWALGEQAYHEVDAALDEMLAWHAKNPDESLISSLLRQPDYQMPLEKIRANIKMTIGGGMNEPRDALGVATWALLTHPDQRAAVAADPSLWSTVFEETIRWVAPIGMYSRQTTRDVELTGVLLPKGARLGICLLSANRDTTVWPDAERFDIHRTVKPHLAFGKGVHVCLGAWVARSEVADVALPLLFNTLQGLELDPSQEAAIAGWVFRGMTSLPVVWDKVNRGAAPAATPAAAAPRVAVVGSGPSGCFSAQAIGRTFPDAQIDIFDSLPVPYGLVRYGVAADHQGTKSVTRQFDRLFASPKVRFHGNTHVGRDLTLDDLREAFDAVVLATGLHEDTPLAIPGADHPGVIGAGHLTRLLNSHPEAADIERLAEQVAIVGHGNVAMDVARLLARDKADFDGSDIHDEAHQSLTSELQRIHLVGRSQPSEAKFDPVMVRELAGIAGVRHVVHSADLSGIPDGKDARVDAVRSLTAQKVENPRLEIHWWFGVSPTQVEAEGAAITALVGTRAGEEVRIPAGNAITAIGFQGNEETPLTPGAHADGRVEPGLYVAGWLRRGPRGTIPDQRLDSQSLASQIANDISTGKVNLKDSPAFSRRESATDFDGWRRIDLLERLGAAPGRERAKFRSIEAMLQAAGDTSLTLPEVSGDAGSAMSTKVPVTIAYATESGGAELVAEELSTAITGDVQVLDLSAASVADIEPERFLILVSSTYGDGEIPSGALGFYEELREAGQALAGLRFAVFGMGDSSYDRTFFRGSELLSEALEAAGANRIGEFGRHDAGGSEPATDAALDWVVATIEEANSVEVAERV